MTAATAQKPRKFTRRRLLKAVAGTLTAGLALGAYSHYIEPRRLSATYHDLPLPRVASGWRGKRIVQLSDLHAGPRVAMAHIEHAIRTAVELQPALIVITGDLIDHTLEQLPQLMAAITTATAKVPVYASLGNHDYGVGWRDLKMADTLTAELRKTGLKLLRNQHEQLENGLTIVGLEDMWSGMIRPSILNETPENSAILVLSHNPDTCLDLISRRWDVMLSGHTHGGQVVVPFVGPLILPVHDRQFAAGMFRPDPRNGSRVLYVNRGIGNVMKVRFNCTPEVTCFTIR